MPGRGTRRLATDDPGRRTGEKEANGAAAGDVGAREPSARLHDLKRRRYSGIREPSCEVG